MVMATISPETTDATTAATIIKSGTVTLEATKTSMTTTCQPGVQQPYQQ